MPTLDDAPTLPVVSALALTDLVQVYDVSANQARTITVAEFLEQAVALLPTGTTGLATGDLYTNSGVLTAKQA
jgi:acetylglutamate kinase